MHHQCVPGPRQLPRLREGHTKKQRRPVFKPCALWPRLQQCLLALQRHPAHVLPAHATQLRDRHPGQIAWHASANSRKTSIDSFFVFISFPNFPIRGLKPPRSASPSLGAARVDHVHQQLAMASSVAPALHRSAPLCTALHRSPTAERSRWP